MNVEKSQLVVKIFILGIEYLNSSKNRKRVIFFIRIEFQKLLNSMFVIKYNSQVLKKYEKECIKVLEILLNC